jgi:hypothetical protein
LEEPELDSIHEHQTEIESKLDDSLGSLNLSNLAHGSAVKPLTNVLSGYIDAPDDRIQDVSKGIVEEATIWKDELDGW